MVIRLNIKDKIPPIFRNKYFLTIALFILWVVFLDSNNLIARYKEMNKLSKLKIDREYYLKKIEEDKRKLHELKTDKHNLEKFAREQYHMKNADEDLYVILTPSEDRKLSRMNR